MGQYKTHVFVCTTGDSCPTQGNVEQYVKFLRDESGATAIEYSLLAGFIALAIIAAVGMTGQRLVALFESLLPALTLP